MNISQLDKLEWDNEWCGNRPSTRSKIAFQFNAFAHIVNDKILFTWIEKKRKRNENYPNKCPARPVEGLDESAN